MELGFNHQFLSPPQASSLGWNQILLTVLSCEECIQYRLGSQNLEQPSLVTIFFRIWKACQTEVGLKKKGTRRGQGGRPRSGLGNLAPLETGSPRRNEGPVFSQRDGSSALLHLL